MAVYLGKNKVGMVKKFTPVDRLQWKCDNVKSLAYEFYYYTGTDLSSIINGLDTKNVTDMQSMFYGCSSLQKLDLSSFNTSNLRNINSMFRDCNKMTDLSISYFDTSRVSNMGSAFYYCSSLTDLDLSNFNMSSVTDMSYMFYGCSRLQKLDLSKSNISKATNLSNTFARCSNVITIDLTGCDISKATNVSYMFFSCNALQEIIGTIDMVSVTSISSMFATTPALEKFTLKNIKRALQIGSTTSYGTKLTLDTLINTIKELWDYSSGTTSYKLTMSTASKALIEDVYVKLVDVTDEMLAQDQYAGNKMPCVVCESTDEGAMLITAYANLKNWTIA